MMTSSNGNIFPVTGHLCGEFIGLLPTQRPVTRSFDVFFDLRLNKRLSKQSGGWSFETPSCSLWRHSNVYMLILTSHDLSDSIDMCMKFILFKRSSSENSPLLRETNMLGLMPLRHDLDLDVPTSKYSMQSMVMTFPGAGHAPLAPYTVLMNVSYDKPTGYMVFSNNLNKTIKIFTDL